jgi:hypothetical protein
MLIIKNKKYSGTLSPELIKTIITSIKTLPEPDIIPMNQAKLTSEEVVLCLQREIAFIDQLASLETKRYLGSKYFSTCILIYMYTETEHAIIHVDHADCLDLSTLIKQFNDTNGMRVILAGGYPCDASEIALNTIIKALFKVAHSYKISITIDAQKIMENNYFSESDKYQEVYDALFRRGEVLYKKYFHKKLDIGLFKNNSFKDFETHLAHVNEDDLTIMAAALSQATEISNIKKKSELEYLSSFFTKHVPNEETFIQLFKAMFSKQGFELTDKGLENSQTYSKNKLMNFAFDLNTKQIIIIPEHLETPYENLRVIPPIDAGMTPHFFMAYTSRTGKYIQPKLSEQFLIKANMVKNLFNQPYIDFENITKQFRVENKASLINIIARFINLELDKPLKVSPSSPCAFFNTNKSIQDLYCSETFTTSNLEALNRVTGKLFQAKLRYHPQYTVDAMLLCDTENEAQMITKDVNDLRIRAEIIKVENNYCYVCVPAINVKCYADTIIQAEKFQI